MKDKRLEKLSDDIRQGIPVDFSEALEVIEYQESIRKNRKSIWQKIVGFFR